MSAEIELAFAGPAALAQLVRDGHVAPRELVEMYLRRIEQLDPRLNAFRVVRAERALAEAGACERTGALAGVPIAIKDDLPLAGETATHGTSTITARATADAEAIRRLRAAGAIAIGITNAPELTIFPWTATAANGVTRNPWDPSRTPGGSSGGSAAAVAAGLAAAATGSDGGGSIRIPAACCGLVGMKPSRGRISWQPRGQAWLGLAVPGALARTVADSALLLDVMRGTLPADTDRAPELRGTCVEAAAAAPSRLRIAVSRKLPPGLLGRLHPGQRGAWERTSALLSDLGHDVIARDPAYGLAQLEFLQLWLRGIHEESLAVPGRDALERTTRQMAAAGGWLVPPRRRRALLARRPATTARIMALWDEFDVLMTPALARTAIGAEGAFGRSAPVAINAAGRFTPFTPLFNLTGQPAVSIPAGIGADGLPLAVQLVGRLGAEETLYALAGQIEAARPWAQHRPPIS
ncbi:MAG: amidase family protein [Solirubrobacteraceae bacterium]